MGYRRRMTTPSYKNATESKLYLFDLSVLGAAIPHLSRPLVPLICTVRRMQGADLPRLFRSTHVLEHAVGQLYALWILSGQTHARPGAMLRYSVAPDSFKRSACGAWR